MKKTLRKHCQYWTLAIFSFTTGCSNSPPVETVEVHTDTSSPAAIEYEVKVTDMAESSIPLTRKSKKENRSFSENKLADKASAAAVRRQTLTGIPAPVMNTESYNYVPESGFILTTNDPLSTFSIDVDTASYTNIRRFINDGLLPPVGAVRLEEMVNYFTYNYPQPEGKPIHVVSELGPCPWAPEHRLVRFAISARKLELEKLPPANLVFLIDVSGSMSQANKLPLLKKSLLLLTDNLSAHDRVSIVSYAGSDRVVLPPTAGDQKNIIKAAIENLTSGGATHGSKGIITAYELARQVHIPQGNNRVILASDGDFNVGVTSRGELERLISKERDSGIFLSVLGFGMGNYHDDNMELLADKGNGNYNYIDSILEAKKVLVKERAATLFTVAKDVKVQVEFNPALVGGYRLVGYDNRQLADEDFNDDRKDAGDMGAGHNVTAVYELLPINSPLLPKVDQLKYQAQVTSDQHQELLTLKIRYKKLNSTQSELITHVVQNQQTSLTQTSTDYQFICAVLGFGQKLRHSEHAGLSYPQLIKLAKTGRGADDEGYRAEFIKLLETTELLDQQN